MSVEGVPLQHLASCYVVGFSFCSLNKLFNGPADFPNVLCTCKIGFVHVWDMLMFPAVTWVLGRKHLQTAPDRCPGRLKRSLKTVVKPDGLTRVVWDGLGVP